jgi:hypothetical protein
MDSFSIISAFFSSAEDITVSFPPTNEEDGGSGSNAYCVVA